MVRGTMVCLLVLLLSSSGRAAEAPAAGDGFWAAWGDGSAELNGYSLTQPRYGQERSGSAVLIFVTEDFSDTARVKADPGKHAQSDVFPVLKLNFVRHFQTGIYDYNVMTSTFARTEFPRAGFWPVVKVSFSAQEWCGHVYEQWLIDGNGSDRGGRLRGQLHSYFDGEADQTRELGYPPGGVLEDALPILVRGLRGDWLAPGERRVVPFLPSSLRARLLHRPAVWGEAVVRRAVAPTSVVTALGAHSARVYTVEEKGGATLTYLVEDAVPHRLLGWRSSTGEAAQLLGSTRAPYWQLNHLGEERMLKRIGLEPLREPPATAPAPSLPR